MVISIVDCQANFDKLSDEGKKHVYKIVDTHIINISKRHPSAFKSCEVEKLSLATTFITESVLTNDYDCNDYFDRTMVLFLRDMIIERYRELYDVDKNKKIVADMSVLSKKIINALNNNINKKVETVKPKGKFSKILDIIFDKPKDKLNKKTINRIHELNKKVDGSYIKQNSPIKGKFIGLVKSVSNIFLPTPKEIKPVEIKPTGLKNLTHDRFNQLIEHNAKTIYAGGDFDLSSNRGPLFVDYNMIDEHNDSLKEESETLSEFISKYNKSEKVICKPMFRKIHKSK